MSKQSVNERLTQTGTIWYNKETTRITFFMKHQKQNLYQNRFYKILTRT